MKLWVISKITSIETIYFKQRVTMASRRHLPPCRILGKSKPTPSLPHTFVHPNVCPISSRSRPATQYLLAYAYNQPVNHMSCYRSYSKSTRPADQYSLPVRNPRSSQVNTSRITRYASPIPIVIQPSVAQQL
jgi:hypothetical protein